MEQKDRYAKMVCLFLAEGLRTRKIDLKRAAEIAEKVVAHINLLETESDFLNLVKELGKDFDELNLLEKKIINQQETGKKRKLEQLAREFAIQNLTNNSQLSLAILKDASEDYMTIEVLEDRYPEFKSFKSNYDGTTTK